MPVGPTCCSNCKGSDKLRIKRMLAKVLLFAYVLSTLFMYIATSCSILQQLNCLHVKRVCAASLIGYVLLVLVKEFGQLLIGISSLLETISRGLYYERMKLSYLCTAE